MASPEKKQEQFFLIRGKKFKIEDELLVLVRRPWFWRKAVAAPELKEIGGMRYYRLSGSCYILYHYALYPCFDSYDYMHESRYFRTFYICRSLAEVQAKHNFIASGKLFLSNLNPAERYRSQLCPYVYYDKDSKILNVYEDAKADDGKPTERNVFDLCNDFVGGRRQKD